MDPLLTNTLIVALVAVVLLITIDFINQWKFLKYFRYRNEQEYLRAASLMIANFLIGTNWVHKRSEEDLYRTAVMMLDDAASKAGIARDMDYFAMMARAALVEAEK